ncbi:MAG: rod shape-determining protein [Deltaproteobacteria bacterium]|nr:rod shape-determining protein [Deltaproteobacteria bacterium]
MKSMLHAAKKIWNRPCIAIDLGTANTRVFCSENGQIREKPSFIRHADENGVKAASDDYLSYLNSKLFLTPLRGGVIVDIKNAVKLLRPLLKETRKGLRHPISLASAPTDTSDRERELLARAVLDAGASYVAILPEVWSAAIGAGMDVDSPHAQVLIDIGEGVTDLAIIRDGRLIHASAVRTACGDLQKAVRSAIVSRHKVCIYPAEAERLTHAISSFNQGRTINPRWITVQGNDVFNGYETTIKINEEDIIRAMEPIINKIITMIEISLKKLSKPIYGEISKSGICLSGGGAFISGIDRLIALKTNLHVRTAPDAIHSVIKGHIETLNLLQGHKNWWQDIVWPRLSS